MRDVLEDNVTGILFPPTDYKALEKSLLRLVKDSILRTQLGARARHVVFERHTWAANARFVVQLAAGGSPAGTFAQIEQFDCNNHSIRRES
jgi:glycosyltransferase involved in cell wall biosynthesis